MAKAIKKRTQRRAKKLEVFPLEKHNYIILGIGVLVIISGYIALMEKTVEGFLPLVVAPILLVLGYCVLIPLGILYTRKEKEARRGTTSEALPQ